MTERFSFDGFRNSSGSGVSNNRSLNLSTLLHGLHHEPDRLAEFVLYYGQLIYPPILMPLCLIGNMANFIVIGKVCTGSSISVYFRWLAVADTVAVFTYLARIWIHAVFKVMINSFNDHICKIWNFTNYTAGDVAIWIMVAVTADRLVAIIKPFLARRICTSKCATISALAILTVMSAKNATIFASFAVVVRAKETKCGYQNDHPLTYFEKHVRPMLTLTLSGLFPVLLIFVLNTAVVVQLIRHRRQMKKQCEEIPQSRNSTSFRNSCTVQSNETQLVNGSKCCSSTRASAAGNGAMKKITDATAKKKNSETAAVVIVLANSIMFFVMVMPQFVVLLFKQFPYGEALRAVQVFTTFLMYCNHSSNFYISYAASCAYRRKVWLTFRCKRFINQPSTATVRCSVHTDAY